MDEIHDALPPRLMRIRIHAGTAERDAGLARHVGHLAEHQAGAADGARAVMHQMPVRRQAVLGGILAHRRDDDAVWERHAAQAEWLEHRCHRPHGVDLEPLPAHVVGDQAIDPSDKFGRA